MKHHSLWISGMFTRVSRCLLRARSHAHGRRCCCCCYLDRSDSASDMKSHCSREEARWIPDSWMQLENGSRGWGGHERVHQKGSPDCPAAISRHRAKQKSTNLTHQGLRERLFALVFAFQAKLYTGSLFSYDWCAQIAGLMSSLLRFGRRRKKHAYIHLILSRVWR